MKHFLTTVLLLTSVYSLKAQQQLSELGCATVTSPEQLQKIYKYVNSPAAAHKTTATVDTIPLTIQIVGKDDGTGYYQLDNLFKVICELNVRYAPVNFYYYIKWPIRYIDNASYYDHDFGNGYQMMSSNNVPNTVNVYFVNDPAGACGYYSPSGDAVAIKKSCALPSSTTLVHELGHYFGLPHTFSGWENGNTPSNPEKVTRGLGANCSFAGDGFCDTDADFISDRWNCPYNKIKYDINGALYHPDSSIYMSYSTDYCQTRFSNQQMGSMQNELVSNYPYLLNGKAAHYSDMSVPNILYPVDSIHSNFKKIIWNKVQGAEYYHVKLLDGGPAVITRQDTITADTVFNISYNMIEKFYKVEVTPLNSVNVCQKKQSTKTALYTPLTTSLSLANFAILGSTVRISPNPTYGTDINVYLDAVKTGFYTIDITNMNGQKIAEQTINNTFGNYTATIPLNNIPGGLYFVQVEGQGQKWIHKVSVIR